MPMTLFARCFAVLIHAGKTLYAQNMGSKTWGQVFHYHISALLTAHCYVVHAKMSGYCHHAYLISDRHKSAESAH